MKRFFVFLMSTILLLLCSGCACKHEFKEADCLNPEVCIHCEETQGEPLAHSFGEWEYGPSLMQRFCTGCGEIEQREMTDEERFHSILRGHWELHTVTVMGTQRSAEYLRTGFWHYYADYNTDGILSYTCAMGKQRPEDTVLPLTVQYSRFDPEKLSHHAEGIAPDGQCFDILLEECDPEPMLYLTPEAENQFFEQVVFSQYQQVLPYACETWSAIQSGKILYTTLNPDWTFTANWGEEKISGTWQLAPGNDTMFFGGIQFFYTKDGKPAMTHGSFVKNPNSEADPETLALWVHLRSGYSLSLRNIPAEQFHAAVDAGNRIILGTWDSKSIRSLIGDDTTSHIMTDYTLTVQNDGTFCMQADQIINGTWILDTVTDSVNPVYYYLFTYPNSGEGGDTVIIRAGSDSLTFSYKNGQRYVYLDFAQYDEAQWADFLAGPELLPGSYTSKKITWEDSASGETLEKEETNYTLTILSDGTVTGTLHQPVTGTWFYENRVPGEGHRYIFRMDHTPPEQSSIRTYDGTLLFDTRIDSQWMTIYFYPQ